MGSPSGGRGPSKKRDRDSTGRSGSRRRRGVGGGEGRGGGVEGVLSSENNGRIRWQPRQVARMGGARPTEVSKEYMWELYLVSNQSSHAPSTCIVKRSSCRISKTWKVRQRKELCQSSGEECFYESPSPKPSIA